MSKKKSGFLGWICFFLFIWAVTATVLLLRNPGAFSAPLKKALPMDLETQTSKSVRSFENVGFLRQFLEQFFTYNSSNFRQTQTALAFSMESSLRQSRLSEIERLKDKLANKAYAQKARLLSMVQTQDHQYDAVLEVQISDSGKEQLFFMVAQVALKEVGRSLENPWGREVMTMSLQPQTSNPLADQGRQIAMSPENPLLLSFNCAVENIRLAKDSTIAAKMTTMNVSEVQLITKEALPEMGVKVGANCKDENFEIEIKSSTTSTTVFLDIDKRYAKQRSATTGQKKKNAYQKTLEDQLDFIIEE